MPVSVSKAVPSDSSASQPMVLKIPRVVKRNTILLALSQAFVGSGTQIVPTVGPLILVQLTGMLSLGGLPMTLTSASRFFIAYPLGKIMDSYGRRAGLILGLALGLLGSLLIGAAPLVRSVPLLIAGMLVFGMGMAAAQQLRLAAADMYPRSRRAEGLGYVLTGSVVGAMAAPLIVLFATFLAPSIRMDDKVLPFFIVPVVIIPAIILVFRMRPDPKEIAANMSHYYPGYEEAVSVPEVAVVSVQPARMPYAKLVAFVSAAAVQGNMIMTMAMTSVILDHHGHALPMISLSVAIHVVGMYGLSLPLGRLVDIMGRRSLILLGLLVSGIGSAMVPASPDWWVVTTGTFLVGLGWSGVYVAATAVLADTTEPSLRGRAVGTNDTIANGAGMLLGFIGGPLVDYLSMSALGVVAVAVVAVPMIMAFRLYEPTPGRYATRSA